MAKAIQLDDSWLAELAGEFEQDYMQQLRAFLQQRREQGATIYPRPSEWFAALDATPFDKVKVVVLAWKRKKEAKSIVIYFCGCREA